MKTVEQVESYLKFQLQLEIVKGLCEEKFLDKQKEGYSGWDDNKKIGDVVLMNRLRKNVEKENYMNVINLAVMLWCRK